jgi:hypothetical protein
LRPAVRTRVRENSTNGKGMRRFSFPKKRAALFTVDPYSGGGGKAVPASGPGSPPSLKPRLQCENANPIWMEGPTRRPRPANSTRLSGARALAIAVCGSARAPNQPANPVSKIVLASSPGSPADDHCLPPSVSLATTTIFFPSRSPRCFLFLALNLSLATDRSNQRRIHSIHRCPVHFLRLLGISLRFR